MLVGVPKEIKTREFRVGLVPSSVAELVHRGHEVVVESKAGAGIGVSDEQYRMVGAEIVESATQVFAKADMIVKVKEPQPEEIARARAGQTIFTYFHFAASRELTEAMVASGATCIAYETVQGMEGGLPLLAPMSQVAGRLAVTAGATALERANGGVGILIGGVP